MNTPIKKALIITNFNIYDKATAAMKVCEKLDSLGCELCTLAYNKDKVIRHSKGNFSFTFMNPEEAYSSVDAVVVLGGDGTILECSRRAAPHGTLVIGLNLGHLGYMAELEVSEIDQLEKIVLGNYSIEERSMLNIEIVACDGKIRRKEFALNDAVISNGTISRMVDIEISEGGSLIGNYRSDGMIVATPTGSTAYSLSAGGSIVDPRLNCFCVTPICPHSLYARPLIFPDSASVEIKNTCQREKSLFLTVDGRINYELFLGEKIKVTRSPLQTRFIRIKDDSFYDRLRQKINDNK